MSTQEQGRAAPPSDSSDAGDAKIISAPVQETILTGGRLAVVFIAMMLSWLLIALDQTILATALPPHCLGWVATSFVLAQTVFLLFYGQVLRIFPAKFVLLFAVALFEIGSLVCAVTQSVGQLIAGRVVSGIGAAGIYVSAVQIVTQVSRLQDRARLYGLFGAVFALASVIGPLIGGAFTDHATWRWCFYLNLPLGGISLCGVALLLKASPALGQPRMHSPREMFQEALGLDFIGAILAAAAVTFLVLALQWGGNIKPWNDKAVIICFVFSGVLAIAYVVWEIYVGERAMTPTTIFRSRSIWAIIVYSFVARFSLLLISYYVPIFYQAVQGRSATKSGIDLLPFMLAFVLAVLLSGQIVGKIGYYWPFIAVAPIFLAIGSGLLYTLSPSTSSAQITGFQILAGVGIGMGMQNALLAVQVEFRGEPRLIGQATAMASFAQYLGGTLGLGVAEPVFSSELTRYLLRYAPDAPMTIVKDTPTAIHTALPAAMIPGVLSAADCVHLGCADVGDCTGFCVVHPEPADREDTPGNES
ncbi:Major facilitator transporter-like protein [Mycena sanguinolenta]|uniref:Major facilitator transporter-like protein n=1 Tax=Mycena sanguinolenta TaxID=230812 RepID=A0A8H7CWM2_9AGAR|nr:Major facilitator transporter-like protein [Mycena sanguinolenta]